MAGAELDDLIKAIAKLPGIGARAAQPEKASYLACLSVTGLKFTNEVQHLCGKDVLRWEQIMGISGLKNGV